MIDQFLTRRYDAKKYNCLHFACDVWEALTGKQLAECFAGLTEGPVADRRFNRAHRSAFDRLQVPESPCIAVFHSRREAPHIGVYYNGKIAHLRSTGAIYQPLYNAKANFDSVRFYKCKNA